MGYRFTTAALAGWLLVGGATAAAQAAPAQPIDAEVPPTPTPVDAGEPAAPQLELAPDFGLLPPAPSVVALPDDPKLELEVHRRRSMLQWHQALGIATTLLMVGTVITGQLDYTDRYGGGTSTGRYDIWHTSFEAGTVVGFTGDALLALFAPVPFPKHNQHLDTLLVHKIAMITAAAGFAAEVPLGIYTVAQEGHLNQGTFAAAHLIIGYVTAVAFATGVTALFF